MTKMIEQLEKIYEKGLCWSIGQGKFGEKECRIYPKAFEHNVPVIIRLHHTYEGAIKEALEELGDQLPRREKI